MTLFGGTPPLGAGCGGHPHTRPALTDFISWHTAQGQPVLTKALVNPYRASLLETGYRSSSINQRLAAIKKLVREATDNQLMDSAVATGIDNVPGAKQKGQRVGNWLTTEQAQ